MTPFRFSSRTGWMTGALAALAGLLFLILPLTRVPIGRSLTDLSYDLPFLFRGNQLVDDVVIIYMDVSSEERLHQQRGRHWDRNLHADLLDVLRRAGTRAVAFDVVFQQGTNEAANERLVQAAKAHGRVAVAAMPGPAFLEDAILQNVGRTLWQPFPELADVAAWGIAEGADDSSAIREHLTAEAFGFGVPSLAWRVAELTSTQPAGNPFTPRWMNYYGPDGYIPHVSYFQALTADAALMSMFSNKVVFVGAWWVVGFTGGKGTDDYRTPHTIATNRKMAGVEVCATAYLNLVRQDWLNRLRPPVEAGLIVLCGLGAGLGLTRVRPITATILGLFAIIAVTLLGMTLPWSSHFWVPWLIPVLVQIPLALGMNVLQQARQLQRDKRALEQTLALARGGALHEPQPASGGASVLASKAPPAESWSPVGIGSSARPSGPSAAVNHLIEASAERTSRQPTVPDHELIRRIGRGAYGEVWLGRDIIGSYHAVKLVFRNAFKEVEPYEREFNGLRRFTPISRQHAGLVHVLQVGRNEREGYLYYVMELGDDVEHGQKIQPASYTPRTLGSDLRNGHRVPLLQCLGIGIHLANALEFLHQHQLIHRDIKPSNIIFVNGVSKFADIGLVTEMAVDNRDVTYLGTKGYIAPEGPGTPAADVYSLGKVIYQMGFGLDVSRFPELPTSVVEDPKDSELFRLNGIVMTACESRMEARYPSAACFGQALADLKARLEGRTRRT